MTDLAPRDPGFEARVRASFGSLEMKTQPGFMKSALPE